MSRRPKSADQVEQQEQPAAGQAAETSSGGSGETSPPEDGTGDADAASHATNPADSVSTSAGGEVAPSLQSDAASDDNPPASEQDGPAVPPAEASASAGAHEPEGDEPAVLIGMSSIEELVAQTLGLPAAADDAAWMALPVEARAAATAIASEVMGAAYFAAERIRALFEPKTIPADHVEVTAKSKDGQPYNRTGVRWGGSYQTEVVSREAYERLAADPNILLKD